MLRALQFLAVLVVLVACGAPGPAAPAEGTVAATPTVPEPAFRPAGPPDGVVQARVSRVVDGDTIDVSPGGRIRLIGIDSPESVDPRRPVGCFGREASAGASALLQGRAVQLEADETQDDKDQFDRRLRYVWLADGPRSGRQANFELIARGFAHEYTFRTPYKYRDLFRQAQEHARSHALGLWSPTTCAGITNRPAPTPARSG